MIIPPLHLKQTICRRKSQNYAEEKRQNIILLQKPDKCLHSTPNTVELVTPGPAELSDERQVQLALSLTRSSTPPGHCSSCHIYNTSSTEISPTLDTSINIVKEDYYFRDQIRLLPCQLSTSSSSITCWGSIIRASNPLARPSW